MAASSSGGGPSRPGYFSSLYSPSPEEPIGAGLNDLGSPSRHDMSKIIQENATVKNLLVAWQNAYAEVERAYESSGKRTRMVMCCMEVLVLKWVGSSRSN